MRFIYSGKRFRQSGTTMQKVVPPSEIARRAAVRAILPGYPVEVPFQSEGEVAEYLSGDLVCCLLCGKHFVALGAHLRSVHNTDGTDYRLRYNIPARFGLVGAQHRAGLVARGYTPENMQRVAELGRSHRATGYRPMCDMAKRKALTAAAAAQGRGGQYEDFSWHLEQARTTYGRTKIKPPPGVASWGTFKKRRSTDLALREAYNAAKSERPVHRKTLSRRAARRSAG